MQPPIGLIKKICAKLKIFLYGLFILTNLCAKILHLTLYLIYILPGCLVSEENSKTA